MSKENPVVMSCGCTANSQIFIHETGECVPSCVIHECTTIQNTIPSLEERTSRCSSCGKTEPSNWNLPFFEYQGDPLSAPSWILEVRNLLLTTTWKYDYKTITDEETRNLILHWIQTSNRILKEKSLGDIHYCGCRGWD